VVNSVSVDVQIASESSSIPDPEEIQSWLTEAVRGSLETGNLEISIRVVDEVEGRQVNKRFRAQDKATNVLSFPAELPEWPADTPKILGDIVICGPLVEREALEQGKKIGDHWAHMLVHGALHLLGYDHESNEDAEVMESLETELLAKRGIADPYAIRP
jgi:probable rRNA maturation factor